MFLAGPPHPENVVAQSLARRRHPGCGVLSRRHGDTVLMQEVPHGVCCRLAQHLGFCQAEKPLCHGVARQDPRIGTMNHDCGFNLLKQRPVLLFRLPQFLLCPLAVRDVTQHAGQADNLPGFDERSPRCAHMASLTSFAPQPQLELSCLSLGNAFEINQNRLIVRIDELIEGATDDLVWRQSREVLNHRADVSDHAVSIQAEDDVGDVLYQRSVARFALNETAARLLQVLEHVEQGRRPLLQASLALLRLIQLLAQLRIVALGQ